MKKPAFSIVLVTIGSIVALSLVTVMTLNAVGVIEVTKPEYSVQFLNYDERQPYLYETTVLEGEEAIYRGEIPTRPCDEDYYYTFIGWDVDITCVTENLEPVAQFQANELPDHGNGSDDPDNPDNPDDPDPDDPTPEEDEDAELSYQTAYSGSVYFRMLNYGDVKETNSLADGNYWDEAPENYTLPSTSESINPLFLTSDKYYATNKTTNRITVKYNATWDYLPVVQYNTTYFSDYSNDVYVKGKNDGNAIVSGEHLSYFAFEKFTSSKAIELSNVSYSNSAYATIEEDYREYANETYTNLSQRIKQRIQTFIYNKGISVYGTDGIDSLINAVINQGTASSKSDASDYNSFYNFVNTFFYGDGCKANEYDYATMLTLALRSFSYPSRLVAGYRSSSEGTNSYVSVDVEKVNYWTEIYIDNVGWMTIDPYKLAQSTQSGGSGSGGSSGGNNDDDNNDDDSSKDDFQGDVNQEPQEDNTTPMFTYTTTRADSANYFRCLSFGSYNGTKWEAASEYPDSNIPENSYNPLRFAANKAKTASHGTEYTINVNVCDGITFSHSPIPSDDIYYNNASNSESASNKIMSTSYTSNCFYYEKSSSSYEELATQHSFENSDIIQHELVYRTFVEENYLDIPSTHSEYFGNLLSSMNLADYDEYMAVEKIVEYIQKAITYNKDFESIPSGEDSILYVLQESKEGVCTHFASAAVEMIRAYGIPARLVKGYLSTCYDSSKEITVTASDAHAWVEVYYEGLGWTTYDPTGNIDIPDEDDDDNPDSPGGDEPATDEFDYSDVYYINSLTYVCTDARGDHYIVKYRDIYYLTFTIDKNGSIKCSQSVSISVYRNQYISILGRITKYKIVTDGQRVGRNSYEFPSNGASGGIHESDSFSNYLTTIDIELSHDISKTYDGQLINLTIDDLSYDKTRLNDGDSLVIENINDITLANAGTHNANFNIKVVDNNGDNVTSNYIFNIKEANSLTYTVEQKEITITTGSQTFTFDNEEHACNEYEITSGSLADGDVMDLEFSTTITYEGTATNVAKVVSITNSEGYDVKKNYRITYVYGTLTVEY